MKKYAIILFFVCYGFSNENTKSSMLKKYNITLYYFPLYEYGLGVSILAKYNIECELFYKKYKDSINRMSIFTRSIDPYTNFHSIGFISGYRAPFNKFKLSLSTGFGYTFGIFRGDYITTVEDCYMFSCSDSTKVYEKLILKELYIPIKLSIGASFRHFGVNVNYEFGILRQTKFSNIYLGFEFGAPILKKQ